MTLPPIHIRQVVYQVCAVGALLIGGLGEAGVIPREVALPVASLLGTIAGALANKAAKQQQKDGTLILTGSVPEQVNKGIEIMANQGVQYIDQITSVGKNLDRLNELQQQLSDATKGVPVVGSLVEQALKLPQ